MFWQHLILEITEWPDGDCSRIYHAIVHLHILNWDAGSKDGSGVIGISFVWPDTASSLSSLSHFEQLVVMRALSSQLFLLRNSWILVDHQPNP
jgi:hypothetical protein